MYHMRLPAPPTLLQTFWEGKVEMEMRARVMVETYWKSRVRNALLQHDLGRFSLWPCDIPRSQKAAVTFASGA